MTMKSKLIIEKYFSAFDLALMAVLWIAVVVTAGGCAPRILPSTNPVAKTFATTPANLQGVSNSMTWIAGFAVIGLGFAIAAVVIVPGDDKIPWGFVAGFGAMLVTALIVKTTLPFLVWILGIGCIGGAVWLGWRWWGRLKKGATA